MNCSKADILIQMGLDGRLSAEERRRLDAHIDHCATCRAAWDEYRRLSQAAAIWTQRAITQDDSGDDFAAQVLAQIAARRRPVRAGLGLNGLGWAGLAVALAIIASFWTGPLLPMHLPALSLAWPLPLPDMLFPDLPEMLSTSAHETFGAWNTLTAHLTLPGWIWSALAAAAAVNAAFAWRALHPTQETATR